MINFFKIEIFLEDKFTINRWNWSEKAGKWVYVTKEESGRRKYYYKVEPPKEFMLLSMEMKDINDKLIYTEDPEENNKLFKQMIKISKKMQAMTKEFI